MKMLHDDLGFRMEHARGEIIRAKDASIEAIKRTADESLERLERVNQAGTVVPHRIDLADADRVVVFDIRGQNWAPGAQEIALGFTGLQEVRAMLVAPLEKDKDYRAIVLIFER